MKSKRIAYLLWFLFGWLGIHRFYCRDWIFGSIYLITFGLFVISGFFELWIGVIGVGWGLDAILTSELVDRANGLPRTEVRAKQLRKIGLWALGILGGCVFALTFESISERLDKRTPEQKAKDALEAKYNDFRRFKRDFPSLDDAGKVVPIQIRWTASELVIEQPKTYGFSGTRFRQQFTIVPKDEFKRQSEEFEGNYFTWVAFDIWSGPSPSVCQYTISIPKAAIPSDFLKNAASQPSELPNK